MKKISELLFGQWTGKGRLIQKSLDLKAGILDVEISISKSGVKGKIGDAEIKRATIHEEKSGYSIKAVLSSAIKDNILIDKDRVELLFRVPFSQQKEKVKVDARFQLKSNFYFDFTSQIGGVLLTKMKIA